jgi:hypothetical protein
VVALTVALAAAIVLILALARRLAALGRRIDSIARGADGASLEGLLRQSLDTTERVGRGLGALETRTTVLERDAKLAVQRVGLVRFNPFEDTGGNQSFAVALLDANEDGLIVSSLHARQGTRIYAKAVAGGRPESALSDEEAEALRRAIGSAPGE